MFNIAIEDLLSPEQLKDYKRTMEYNDNNINGFGLPITINDDKMYYECLEAKLQNFYDYISKKSAFNTDDELLTTVKGVNSAILEAIDEYLQGNIESAQSKIYSILKSYKDDVFFVSPLDSNYAFKGIAPIKDLQCKEHDYTDLMSTELTFFRARKSDTMISSPDELSFIPLDRRELVATNRFSIAGIPCLYLGVTSYCCWLELNRPARNEFYCSALKVKEKGKKLKILNLVISEGLINGIFNRPIDKEDSVRHQLQRKMIMSYPLILATSFNINQKGRSFKSEYIISQLIMQCLSKLKIDGIAYMSKKSYSDYEYPHNVNVAIPVNKNNINDIRDSFSISYPLSLEVFSLMNHSSASLAQKSYINTVFNEGFSGQINPCKESISYNEIIFSAFDDYLVNRK